MMNRAYALLSPTVLRYDGTIARLMGDGLLAFFGAPVAHEDDPVRAVHAGLDMIAAISALAAEVKTTYGIDFALRVGISAGVVVLGEVGSDLKNEYTAMGDAVNVASRLQAKARPMTLLISAEVYQRVANQVEATDRGALSLRGKISPVRAYEVRARKSPRVVQSGSPAGVAISPLIGRERELRLLSDAFDRLMNGTGGLALVVGEAGMGKTRLLMEARRGLKGESVMCLEGRAVAVGHSISYWPFLEILRSFASTAGASTNADVQTDLQSRLERLFGDEALDILPYLCALLGVELRGELADRVRYLDAEAMGRQVFRAFWRFVERLASERPVALIFEDAHWMDESSALLIEHLLELIASQRVLICLSTRPDADVPAARLATAAAARFAQRYTEVRLGPLEPDESLQLIQTLPGGDTLGTTVRDQIVEKTEGNPFFTQEVVRSLVEHSSSDGNADLGVSNRARPFELEIPDTVQGVIAARIDRLELQPREVLRVASVIGRTFDTRVLRALVDDEQLPTWLADLRRLDLIYEERDGRESAYSFNHALTHETTYASILRRQRTELHRSVATTIQSLFAARIEEFYGLLAYHYAQAEDLDRAQEYLFKAGDQAGRVAADAEALAHYQQALAAWERIMGDRMDPVQQASLDRKIGEALFRRGEYQQARRHLERALAELRRPLPTARWRIRAIIVRETTRQIGRCLLPLPAEQVEPHSVSPGANEAVLVYRPLCWMDVWSDRERFLLEALLVLRQCEESGHRAGEVQALSALAMISDFLGRFWLAERFVRRAIELAERSTHPIALGTAYGSLGHHYHTRGETSHALREYRRSTAAFERAGDVRGWGASADGRSLAMCLRGDFAGAIEQSRETIRIGEEAGDPHVQGWGRHSLGEALLHVGPLDLAEEQMQRAVQQLSAVQDQLGVLHTMGLLGQCRLRQGDAAGALDILQKGDRLRERYQLRGANTCALVQAFAEVRLRLAETASGVDRPQALVQASDAVARALAQGRTYPVALASACRWQGTYEWMRDCPEEALKAWAQSLQVARALESRIDEGLTLLEIGRTTHDDERLREAARLLEALGAAVDAGRAWQRQLTAAGHP